MVEVLVVLFLIGLNGFFVLSELALVSSRRARLQAMAESHYRGAKTALYLLENPGRFLSTMQIGITLVGILTGAFSGNALGEILAAYLEKQGMGSSLAQPLGFGLVVAVITYLSIVVGELLPKRLALKNPEVLGCLVARPIRFLCAAAKPIAWLLDASTTAIFGLFGIETQRESSVTDEEIRTIVKEAESTGVIETQELHMISGVMRLGDCPVKAVLTPRADVEWIDLDSTLEEQKAILISSKHSCLPVGRESTDNLLGVVQTRELLAKVLAGETLDILACMQKAPLVPDTADALVALALLREASVPMALVLDEYGHFEGLVTPANMLEAIAGAFRDQEEKAEDAAQRAEDGSWILPGWLGVDEMSQHLDLKLPEDRDYFTAAGYILEQLERLPEQGERIQADGWNFEILELAGNRIEKIKAAREGEEVSAL